MRAPLYEAGRELRFVAVCSVDSDAASVYADLAHCVEVITRNVSADTHCEMIVESAALSSLQCVGEKMHVTMLRMQWCAGWCEAPGAIL